MCWKKDDDHDVNDYEENDYVVNDNNDNLC